MGNKCWKKKTYIKDDFEENLMTQENYLDKSDTIIKNYFDILKNIFHQNYEENRNNEINLSLCLDKRDFETIITTKKVILNKKRKFVYWKDYLLNYLNKKIQLGYSWADGLSKYIIFYIRYIKLNMFLTENKFLSLFFIQELELNNQTKKFGTLLNSPRKDSNRDINIVENMNASFCSINTDTLSVNDPTHEYKEYRKKVRSYMMIFKEHIINPNHPINLISLKFIEVFKVFIEEKMEEIKISPDDNVKSKKISDEVTAFLQKFILKLQTAIRLMYCKTINYQYFTEERDEFINLVTNFIFNNTSLYQKLSKLYKMCMSQNIKVFKRKLESMKKINAQDLGIDQKFCLNEFTVQLQKKLLEIENEKSIKITRNSDSDLTKKLTEKLNKVREIPSYESSDASIKSNLSINFEIKEKPKETFKIIQNSLDIKSRTSHKNSYPYECAIKTLRSIKNYKIPYEKMLIISSISSEIKESVNDFWKDMDRVVTSSLLNIDADELMSIFIYIILKSQMSSLLVHMKLIKEFTTSVAKNTMVGYYFVTLDASIMFILEMDENNIMINRDKLRISSSRLNQNSFIDDNE